MPPAGTLVAKTFGDTLRFFCLLWLAGLAMRMTLLVVPPVIPLIHEDLRMSETQIGLLIGLPLAVFAIAAVPGSLLVARGGAKLAVMLGMAITALAGGLRGAAVDVWTLYAAVIATGFGIAIMQPGMPTLLREWLPNRVGLGTVVYSNGMVMGAILPPVLAIPFILPLVGGSWRLNFFVWAVPAILIATVFFLLSPKEARHSSAASAVDGGLWWPDWRNPLIWLLGLTFGCNNSPFFAANAFLGDYLASRGQADWLGPALASLNGAQLVALVLLFVVSGRLQRRAWPFLLFGPLMFAGFLGLILIRSPLGIVVSTGLIGVSTVMTMTPILALPPLLAAPADVARTAAGMLTISYTCAIIIPTLCGALWDATGRPWIVFAPLCLCALALTVLGASVSRRRPAAQAAHS
jgi:CP family cyanate transporter-like MFS transporter